MKGGMWRVNSLLALALAAGSAVSAQKLDESLFVQESGNTFSFGEMFEEVLYDLDQRRAEQSGFQVSFQFSWLVAPEAFDYSDGLNILTRTAEVMHPEWSNSEANDFSQSLSNSGLWNRFSNGNRAARPWGIRLAWVKEDLLPLSLSAGFGQMGVDYYIEGRLADDASIGLNANQLRAVTFVDDYFRMKEQFGNVWWFPQDPKTPDPFSAYYVEAGIGKRVHPLASLFVHYRQPLGVADRIRSGLAAENTAFDEPTVTIRDGASAHFGPIFSIQAQYHGRFMEWGLERIIRTAPTGTWPDYLIENGAIPFDARSHTELSIGLRF